MGGSARFLLACLEASGHLPIVWNLRKTFTFVWGDCASRHKRAGGAVIGLPELGRWVIPSSPFLGIGVALQPE